MQRTATIAAAEQLERPTEALKVLYIGGNARCGSTLLGRLLGRMDGFVLVGEPQNMWDRCFRQNRLCGCGVPFHECEFWSAVAEQAFGGFDGADIDRIIRTKQTFEQMRTLPRLLSTGKNEDIEYYVSSLAKMYRAIKDVSQARVIVDASKSPLYAYFVARIPEIQMRMVHLVRDSRAVAYSNQRKKINPAVHWKKETFGTSSPFRSSVQWSAHNFVLSWLYARSEGFACIRYEDFVANPQPTLERVCDLVGEKAPDLNLYHGITVDLGSSHTTAGNPDRFKPTVTIRKDTEWEEKLPARQKMLVTSLTLPLLLRYGYYRKQKHA